MSEDSRFEVLETPLSGLKIIRRKPLGDARGYLERMFCSTELKTLIPHKGIVQINHTLTEKRGVVRGMHFQNPPHTEIKFVSCLRGEVFDVAVDIRRDSPTFLKWYGEVLSAENHKTLLVPEGFAHGFQTLTADCEMLYFHTAAYRSESESGLNAEDAQISIRWPLTVLERSARDTAHPVLTRDFEGISV